MMFYCCQLIAIPKLKINPITNLTISTKTINISAQNKKLVSYYIRAYSRGNQLSKIIKRSEHFFKHIMMELEKRNLPKELALIPIVESSYKPLAISNRGAFGIWQISYSTGKRYGLIHPHQDARTDLKASTNAALSYLEFLYEKFDNDWLLALAAYNAGEGRISKAIKKNKFIGGGTDYWALNLPQQTKHYVPKLLALSIIFEDPEAFGLDLPAILPKYTDRP